MGDGEQKDGVDIVAWFDAVLDAYHWFGLYSIAPKDAAMLLCQYHPRNTNLEEVLNCSNEEIRPGDLRRLYEKFEDDAQRDPRSRKLLDWLNFARENKLKYHSWIDEYLIRKPEAAVPAKDAFREAFVTAPERDDQQDAVHAAPEWVLVEPERERGYNVALYRTLKKARNAGLPIPKPWQILDEWRDSLPGDIAVVLSDGFVYYKPNGSTETAGIDALRISISRMTRKRE